MPKSDNALHQPETVKAQYATAGHLSTRISIHSKYSVNKQGFGPWILSHYPVRPGMRVLELGCGTGEMWADRADIIEASAQFVLSDFSEGMLEKAKENLKAISGIEFRVIDIQDIPFPADTFDLVIANMMLYHVPDLPKALGEVRRVLRPDGTFCCATYGENGMMAHIAGMFRAYGIEGRTNNTFTLQNGQDKLRPFFSEIQRRDYPDALDVTDIEDMADYIESLSGFSELRQLPREVICAVLHENCEHGVLHIPKEYGMFIAK